MHKAFLSNVDVEELTSCPKDFQFMCLRLSQFASYVFNTYFKLLSSGSFKFFYSTYCVPSGIGRLAGHSAWPPVQTAFSSQVA